jgi:hypothetical protein
LRRNRFTFPYATQARGKNKMGIRSAIGAGLVAALAMGPALPAYAVPQDVPRATLPSTASDQAEQALARVRALFDSDRPANARASVHPDRDATLALRDLVRVRDQLRGSAAREASRLLARPTARRSTCLGRICVHWNPAASTRAYVDRVLATVTQVHEQYVAAGYRAPRPDGRRGGDNKTDIYLRDVGAQGLYGFCTTDKRFRATGPFDSWAYCVLDDDYRQRQFPALTPTENMQVTAAHEYFHAVQFAYDAFEDSWFMEATATWAEDEVFDDINDNLQYLRAGPLRRPHVPLDKFEVGGTHQYGDWIFFRYLTEQLPTGNVMPDLVRQMWERADGSRDGPDMYSLKAVRSALTANGESFARMFARFAEANRHPAEAYDEGDLYPTAPLSATRTLRADQSSGWISRELDHLSSTTLRFTPSGLVPPTSLKVRVDLANRSRGALALVTTRLLGGVVDATSLVDLNRLGVGTLDIPLVGNVSNVEVTLVNASTRTRCWRRATSPYSCFGVPRDDNLTQKVRVSVQ